MLGEMSSLGEGKLNAEAWPWRHVISGVRKSAGNSDGWMDGWLPEASTKTCEGMERGRHHTSLLPVLFHEALCSHSNTFCSISMAKEEQDKIGKARHCRACSSIHKFCSTIVLHCTAYSSCIVERFKQIWGAQCAVGASLQRNTKA